MSNEKRNRTYSEGTTAWGRASFHAVGGILNENFNGTQEDRLSLQLSSSAGATSSLWSKIGTISDRASEVLEDARLTFHGKEKKLYDASIQRLSVSNDVALSALGERASIGRASAGDDASLAADIAAAHEMIDRSSIEISMIVAETHWKGTLSKRSEWLRRWERSYFVLDGIQLKRKL